MNELSPQFDVIVPPEAIAVRESVGALATRIREADSSASPDRTQSVPGEVRDTFHDIGLLAPVAEAFGGGGVPDALTWFMVADELASGDPGVAYDLLTCAHAWLFVDACGSDAQRARFAELAARTSRPLASVLYHEGQGRGPLELATTARRVGDGWVLSGRKIACARALDSDLSVVIAREAGELRAFAVSLRDLDRVRIVRDDAATGMLGLRAARTATLELDDVALDAGALLDVDQVRLHRCVAEYRLMIAALSIGAATASLRHAAEYVVQREAFGSPIAAFQGVSFPLAEVDIAVDAARLGAWSLITSLAEFTEPAELGVAVAAAVARATEAGVRAAVVGVNSLGGHGFLMDHPQERYYRDATVLSTIDFDPLFSAWDAIPTA